MLLGGEANALLVVPELVLEVRHADGSNCSFYAFIAVLAARPLLCLGFVIRSKQPKYEGDAVDHP